MENESNNELDGELTEATKGLEPQCWGIGQKPFTLGTSELPNS
jgi:hypothetical protein